jgi:hypothetical protein
MFEHYGWLVLRSSTGEESDDDLIDGVVVELRAKLKEINLGEGLRDLRAVNGRYQLCLAGRANHKSTVQEELLALLVWIGQVAPGSYGLLYTRDDDDLEGSANVFRVWRLARGALQERPDGLLSPCMPVIEDDVLIAH